MLQRLWLPRACSHLLAWAAVCGVLLKAAVPLLATASAHEQGKALAEICTVYGVVTVTQGDAGSAPTDPSHPAGPAGDPCALSALVALATPLPALPHSTVAPGEPEAREARSPERPDVSLSWLAQRQHGPPAALV